MTAEAPPQAANRRAVYSWRGAFLFVALAATGVVAPMFFLGNASGHDFRFHIGSWMDVASQWREGIFYPRWAEWANWGFGEPRFIFYPPASWMLGATLGSVLPWIAAPGAFIWLTLVAAGMAMWRMAREWLTETEAVAAAIFFAVNPYHLAIVYYRSDFAELLACALYPLLLWGVLHVVREGWRRAPVLAIIFAAIWLSNAPAGVIATYTLVLLLLAGCILQKTFRPLVPGAAAMALGFGVAAFYILPAAWEQRWVQIAQVISSNLNPSQNFIFTHAADPEFLLFNWKASGVALGMMLITAVAAVFAARWRRDLTPIWGMLLALAAVSVLLMFPVSGVMWRHLPELRFIQFPWRWLGPMGVVFAFFAAAAAPRKGRGRWAAWAAIAIVIAGTGSAIVGDAWFDNDDLVDMTEALRSGHGYTGVDEYSPLGCERDPADVNASGCVVEPGGQTPRIGEFDAASGDVVPAKTVGLHVMRWNAEQKIFTEESAVPVTLVLRVVNYPAWEVRVDGKNERPDAAPDTAQMLLPLPKGSHQIEARFRRTRDRSVGDWISLANVTFIMIFAAVLRRGNPMATR